MRTLLAIDQGTTSSRTILFSLDGDILDIKQKQLTLHYPHKGWVEQDANDIWQDTLWACEEALKSDKASDIQAIGITNQRETTILWDKETGEPVYNAVVWQDGRTVDFCQEMKGRGHEKMVTSKTGLLLNPYFSATKIKWILDNVEGVRERANEGKILFGTVDCFLLHKLTRGKVHKTDITNAARTMLFNIHNCQWDEELLVLFDIPKSILPEVVPNCHDFGVAHIGKNEIPITGMAGDQQSASFGQACFDENMVKSTYGTGCFALMNTGATPTVSHNKLLSTIAYQVGDKPVYALEGSIFVAGAAIQWLRDNLGFFDNAAQSEILANSVDDNNDVYFIPAFTGLGAPHWRADARAAITGLTRETTKAHITRAALEAQAYQTYDLFGAFENDSGQKIERLRVDGGLVKNTFVCQFLADILNCPVDVPKVTETTALGAAYLAGLHIGLYKDLDEIAQKWKIDKTYLPEMSDNKRETLLLRWNEEVGRLLT